MVQANFRFEAEDVVGLSDPTHVVEFFTQLGYFTDLERNEKSPKALRNRLHDRSELRNKIAGVTHVAQQQDEVGTLDIYLYDLPRLTRTLRRDIVKDVQKFSSNCLLILADHDFHELEFVYLDRVAKIGQENTLNSLPLWEDEFDDLTTSSTKPLIRIQRVDRRHPSQMMVKMLREFRLKTTEVLGQCKFLSYAFDDAETRDIFFNNRSLFSNYYLNERLRGESEWQDEENRWSAGTLTQKYNAMRKHYDGASERFIGVRKQEIRQLLFEPILEELGFTVRQAEAQASYDYLFTVPQQNSSEARVVCLVYPWGRLLDDPLTFLAPEEAEHDETASENPAATLVAQIQEAGAQWGILTNGKLWRLYSAKARSRSTNYYEIDLEDTFSIARLDAEKAITAFFYFWLFFRREAFVVKPALALTTQLSFLDKVLAGSEHYAQALSASLKERVFDEIFPQLAQGFVEYALETGLLRADLLSLPEEARNHELEPYFTGTLNFLYRLLFLLYAESRELLPVNDERYRKQSLEALKQEIRLAAGETQGPAREEGLQKYGTSSAEKDCRFYTYLWKLFVAIDQGDPSLNVPAYRGDIFLTEPPEGKPLTELNEDEQIALFLKRHKIPDYYLALGLDLLARDVDPDKKGTTSKDADRLNFVDYRSLGVRQLGSIYEGLLEFKLRIAVENMVIVENKVQPAREINSNGTKQVRIAYKRRQVYIENDLHERKATGSYYTPDYIVKYIIAETVGPILRMRLDKERNEILKKELSLYQQRVAQEKKQRRLSDETKSRLKTLAETHKQFVDEFFNLKVIDPAMGSGHFLVDAVDYITDYMVERLRTWSPTPLDVSFQIMREAILTEAEEQKVSIDPSLLTMINLLKRQVLKRCIFGVDINPMAVRLAKLSLWIDCLTQGAPFSFLDHHLRCGNSLLGVTLEFMNQKTGSNLWTHDLYRILTSVKGFEKISRSADETPGELDKSRSLYADAIACLEPHLQISNLWLSECYGNKGARTAIETFGSKIIDGSVTPELQVTLQSKRKRDARRFGEADEAYANVMDLLNQAQQISAHDGREGHNFFHWDLEFPEVFFDETGPRPSQSRGFDAVIGNPPYVRQEGLGIDKDAFADLYEAIFSSIADLYTYFIARGHELLHDGARFGMITSNKFIRAGYGSGLRAFLPHKTRLEKLINFGELRVFNDAATDPVIVILSEDEPASTVIYVQVKDADFRVQNFGFENMVELVQRNAVLQPRSAFRDSNWLLSSDEMRTVLEKIELPKLSHSLKIYVQGKIQYGVKTGDNDAFFIDKAMCDELIAADPKSAEIIKPLLIGDNVRKYFYNFEEQYLIFTRRGIDITRYPAVERYLSRYRAQLEPRPSNWDTKKQGKWPGRKLGPYKWYEIQDNVAYYADFEKPKIIYPIICKSSRFTFDEHGYFSNDKTFVIPKADKYLLALLNSRLLWQHFKEICSVHGDADAGGRLELRAKYVETAPIRRIKFTTPEIERTYQHKKNQQRYQDYLDTGNWQAILAFTQQMLARDPEAADVIHDLLAFLADRMLYLNEKRQEEERRFLNFVEHTFKIQPQPDPKTGKTGLETLSSKTTLFEYAGDYQKGTPVKALAEIQKVLTNNRKRCLLYEDRFKQALKDLGSEYERSRVCLELLKQQLKATNELIDQIVYRLYGLTEEEMMLLEGIK